DFRADVLEGQYLEHGEKSVVGHYRAGKKDGTWSTSRHGVVVQEELYENGERRRVRQFWGDGTLHSDFSYGPHPTPGAGTVLEGEARTLFPEGRRQTEGAYHLNARTGMWRRWHSDGTLLEEHEYAVGRATPLTRWYEDGQKREEGPAILDVNEGLWREWHPNGQLAGQGEYHALMREGRWQFFHQNGERKEKGEFKAGVKSGRWREWHDNGRLAVEAVWSQGHLEGRERRWNRDGELWSDLNYRRGLAVWSCPAGLKVHRGEYPRESMLLGRDFGYLPDPRPYYCTRGATVVGLELLIGSDGHQERRTHAASGREVVMEKRASDGTLMEQGRHRDNLMEGAWVYRHANGRISEQVMYRRGVREGPYSSFWEDGRPREEGQFHEDKREGLWKYSSESGEAGEQRFSNDVPASIDCPEGTKFAATTVQSGGEQWCEDASGVRQGPFLAWSGTHWRRGQYRSGKEDGSFTFGVGLAISTEGDYVDGRREGTWKSSEQGRVSSESYRAGLRDGTTSVSDSSGRWQVEYRADRLEGRELRWYPNGQLAQTGRWRKGAPIGLWPSWTPEGRLLGTSMLPDGSGERMLWQERGVTRQESWRDGMLDGFQVNWRNGERISQTLYRRGQVVARPSGQSD
ncbi:MAG: hypothetical protein HY901_01640, partial [Deltaproteobacteria bacterium]|nr:hypothetical protein [Deltaproteobacteria bacterium]